jgi:hypothetical protein
MVDMVDCKLINNAIGDIQWWGRKKRYSRVKKSRSENQNGLRIFIFCIVAKKMMCHNRDRRTHHHSSTPPEPFSILIRLTILKKPEETRNKSVL